MGHHTSISVDDIHWFAGYGPVEIDGECDHECPHRSNAVIAWGPSLVHYELVRCTHCDCRAWRAALPGSHGGIHDSHPYLKPRRR